MEKMNNQQLDNQLEKIEQQIEKLTQIDPVLKRLPSDVSLKELEDIVGLHEGRCWKIIVERYDGQEIELITDKESTISALKKSLQFYFTKHLKRSNVKLQTKISWKCFWKRYDLCLNGLRLLDNSRTIKDFGIVNNSKLHFLSKINKQSK
ncbi:U11/U12 small nuclear ribonucleoprotein 25 kDa protein-like [Panonychus citri]|uniref:U11/U12 small nuclear ribonucleoprotein 25 kDa protein-like n=1 Tax=Panonychus citri TaxID=50023 RepID=UPI0023071EFB|nr:U11/U12 small nuclear ribonucleoprotein 25 kDa protein-like [Panonychus citri]